MTILSVLMAISLLSVALLGFLGLLYQATRVDAMARERNAAVGRSKSEIENYLAMSMTDFRASFDLTIGAKAQVGGGQGRVLPLTLVTAGSLIMKPLPVTALGVNLGTAHGSIAAEPLGLDTTGLPKTFGSATTYRITIRVGWKGAHDTQSINYFVVVKPAP